MENSTLDLEEVEGIAAQPKVALETNYHPADDDGTVVFPSETDVSQSGTE
jgi:hypothetical protein